MAILHRFLQLLEFLEQTTQFIEFLTTPVGMAASACLVSYQVLLLLQCDSPSAAVLASAIALTLHCGFNRPKF